MAFAMDETKSVSCEHVLKAQLETMLKLKLGECGQDVIITSEDMA